MAVKGTEGDMKMPELLAPGHEDAAVAVLSCNYGRGNHGGHRPFTGARFDAWDSTGKRSADANKFTADDLVAVSFLSVAVPAAAAAL